MKPTHDSLLLRVSCLRTHQTVMSHDDDDDDDDDDTDDDDSDVSDV